LIRIFRCPQNLFPLLVGDKASDLKMIFEILKERLGFGMLGGCFLSGKFFIFICFFQP
jgi:hypothetical protein